MYNKNLPQNIENLVNRFPSAVTVYDPKIHGMMLKNRPELDALRGVWVNFPEDAYFQIDAAVSCSSVIKYWLTMSTHSAHYAESTPLIGSDAIRIGKASDEAFFYPNEFASNYIKMPVGIDKRTAAGKAKFAELESSGKIILASDDYDNALKFAETLRADKAVCELWKNCIPQIVVVCDIEIGHDAETGEVIEIPVKGMIDLVDFEDPRPIVWDLKSIADIRKCDYQIDDFNYDVQLAIYRMLLRQALGIDINRCGILFWEKQSPYDGRIRYPDQRDLKTATDLFYIKMLLREKCKRDNFYPRDLIGRTHKRSGQKSLNPDGETTANEADKNNQIAIRNEQRRNRRNRVGDE